MNIIFYRFVMRRTSHYTVFIRCVDPLGTRPNINLPDELKIYVRLLKYVAGGKTEW